MGRNAVKSGIGENGTLSWAGVGRVDPATSGPFSVVATLSNSSEREAKNGPLATRLPPPSLDAFLAIEPEFDEKSSDEPLGKIPSCMSLSTTSWNEVDEFAMVTGLKPKLQSSPNWVGFELSIDLSKETSNASYDIEELYFDEME